MQRISRLVKMMYLAVSGTLVLGTSGSCVPDNLWANILGDSIITGTVEAIRNTVLVALNLQTP